MLRLVVALALLAVCLAQTVPKVPETFTSYGEIEYHDNRGTFFGNFTLDRDQVKNMGMENFTYAVGNVKEYTAILELYIIGDRYTIRDAGSGDVHCQIEKVSGKLPEFWGWVEYAKYMGKETHRHVVYDKWQFNQGGVELILLVLPSDPNTPKLFERRAGQTRTLFAFRSFSAVKPPASVFTVPSVCSTADQQLSRIPFYKLKPPM